MRISYVAHELALPGRHGGVGRYLRAIGGAMVAEGHEVNVLLPGRDYSRAEGYGMQIQYVPAAGRDPISATEEPRVELAILSWLTATRPEVVHIQHLFGLSARVPQLCRQLGIPVVLHVHDGSPYCTQAHFHRQVGERVVPCGPDPATDGCAALTAERFGCAPEQAVRYIDSWREDYRAAMEQADHVIFVSRSLQDDFQQTIGWKPRSSQVLPPALDWPQAKPTATPPVGNAVRFGVFGLVTPIKGLDRVLDAFGQVDRQHHAELQIHGRILQGMPGAEALQQRVDHERSIIEMGSYEPADIPGRMAGVDWVIVGSHYESSSLVVDEARACGVPAIVANVGGMPEKLAAGGGIVVDAADPDAFAEALEHACDPRVLEQARATLSQPPNLSDQVRELQQIYERIAGDRSEPELTSDGVSVLLSSRSGSNHQLAQSADAITQQLRPDDELLVVRAGRGHDPVRALNRAVVDATRPRIVVVDADVPRSADWRDELAELPARAPLRTPGAASSHAAIPVWALPGGAIVAWRDDIALNAGWAGSEVASALSVAPAQQPHEQTIARRALAPVNAPADPASWEQRGLRPGLVSIVMLTLNGLELTRDCIASIERCTPESFELIVIDNGSTDGTLDYLATLTNVKVIANATNLGFGAGCNQGMAAARGERVLLLNNDTIVTPGWLGALARALDEQPLRGIAAPRSNRIADVQQLPLLGYDGETLSGLDTWATRYAERRAGHGFALARAVGFCMLMRRELIDAIGGFDLRFGMGNFEDDDICLRAAVAGYDSWICDDSFVHHLGSRTFVGNNIDHASTMAVNWQRFATKWGLPQGANAGSPVGYNSAPVVARTEYSLQSCYAPLVASQPEDGDIYLERKSQAVLVAATPFDEAELERSFLACCERWTATDNVTVVVRIVPGDTAAFDVLERVAANYSNDALVDVAIVEAGVEADVVAARACSDVICGAELPSAQIGLALWCNARPLLLNDLATLSQAA